MNYLVAPRNYDRDFGGRTPGFGDMDEYGLPRGMSPEDKREVLDRFPLPGERGGTEMPSVGFAAKDRGPRVPLHQLDPTTPEEREAHRILVGEPKIDTRGMDPFSPNPFGDRLLDYLNKLERNRNFKDLLFRPTDKFDIRKPVYRPQDKVEVQPLEVATNYTTYTDVLPEDVEMRRRIEDAAEEKSPTIKLDPSKLDLREYRQPGPYRPGEDLDRDRFIKSYRSPIASNPETGKRDFFYQYLEQNKEVIGPRTQMFDRFADPDDGTLTAGMPRYIRGHQYAPRGVIMTVPDIDSRIFNERVKRGYVPMTPPPSRGAGPQLPGFV